jgi:hypothetical protein
MSWAEKIRVLQSLDGDIPDERIEALADVTEAEVESFLGSDNYDQLSGDKRLDYAICALTIGKVILTSRKVNEGSSLHRTSGWGEGNIYPSEINDLTRMAKEWEKRGNETLNQLKAEIPAEIGWIDI